MDVYVLKLDNYFQVSHKNLDHRSNQNDLHVSLLRQGILFREGPNSYSQQ